ncbi:MAG: hypothetical protein C0501_20635 [Isosphaera sp.]|nr:hypothetical protein [Isosphaera sp.]
MYRPSPVPLDTVLPGHDRRRAWSHPELASHRLLALTFDRLYLAPLTNTPDPAAAAAVENGADLDRALGPLPVVIDLIAVRRLRLDLTTNTVAVEYVGTGLGVSRQAVTFSAPEAADACFARVWRRLGDGYELAPYRRAAWSAARAPLLLLLAALLATAVTALVLSVFEDMAEARSASRVGAPGLGELGVRTNLPQSPLEMLLGWLDWRAVCAAGGAVAAASQVWLYRRLTAPPTSLEVVRK